MPLTTHSILQSLRLLPSNHVLPPRRAFSLRAPHSPFYPTPSSEGVSAYLSSQLFAPGLLVWLFERAESWVAGRAYESWALHTVLRRVSIISAGLSIPSTRAARSAEVRYEDPTDSVREVVTGRGEALDPSPHGDEAVHFEGRADDQAGSLTRPPAEIDAPYLNTVGIQQELDAAQNDISRARISSVDAAEGSMAITVQVGEATESLLVDPLELSEFSPSLSDRHQRQGRSRTRSTPHRTLAPVVSPTDMFQNHLAALVANVMVAPLRLLVLQRVALTFRRNYTWTSSPRMFLWYPRSSKDIFALCNRWLLSCGLELIVRLGLWAGELAYVTWQRPGQVAAKRSNEV